MKRLLLILASIAVLAFGATTMAVVSVSGSAHSITSTRSPSATDYNAVTLHVKTVGIRV